MSNLIFERVTFKTIRHLMYAAYWCGAMTVAEGKTLDHPDAIAERSRFDALLLKELS